MRFSCTDGALLLPWGKLRLAIRANRFCRAADSLPGDNHSKLLFKMGHDALRRRVLRQRIAPAGEARFAVKQFQGADTGMIVALQGKPFTIGPVMP